MLNIFSGVMILLIVAEIAAVVMAFIYYPQVDEFMQQRVENYNPNSTTADDIFNKEFVDQLPDSCCTDNNEVGICSAESAYQEGCESQIQKGTAIIGGVAAGCIVLELIALVSACA